MSTGPSERELYTDSGEVIFKVENPVILNGIEDIVSQSDLISRSVLINLGPMNEADRITEAELWSAFEVERPGILGALLDTLVIGLRMLPEITIEAPPRMADFANRATARETAFWPSGTFLAALNRNQIEGVETGIETDPVASAVRALMGERGRWRGTATDLLADLEEIVDDRVIRSRYWPRAPHTLSGRLTRAATILRAIGIEITHERSGRSGARLIYITMTGPVDSVLKYEELSEAAPAAPARPLPKKRDENQNSREAMRSGQAVKTRGRHRTRSVSASNPKPADATDAADANFPASEKHRSDDGPKI